MESGIFNSGSFIVFPKSSFSSWSSFTFWLSGCLLITGLSPGFAGSASNSGTFSGSFSVLSVFIISSGIWSSSVSVTSSELSFSSFSSSSAFFLAPPKISRIPFEILSWMLSAPSFSLLFFSILIISGCSSSSVDFSEVSFSRPFSSSESSGLSCSAFLIFPASSGLISFGTNCFSYFAFSSPVSSPIRCFRSYAFITYFPSLNQRIISLHSSRLFSFSPAL